MRLGEVSGCRARGDGRPEAGASRAARCSTGTLDLLDRIGVDTTELRGRLALARVRGRRARAGHDAPVRRADLRRGRAPPTSGSPARTSCSSSATAPSTSCSTSATAPAGWSSPARRGDDALGRGRASPRGDADRDQVPADRRAVLRGGAAPGRGDRGQGLRRAGAARRPRRRDRRPRGHRADAGGERPRGARGDRHAAPRGSSPTASPTSFGPPRSTGWPSGCGRRRTMKIERIDWDGRDAPGARRAAARARAAAGRGREAEVARIVDRVRDGGDERPPRDRGEPRRGGSRVAGASIPEAIAAAPGLLDPDVREALRARGEEHRRGGARGARGPRPPGDRRAARGAAGRGSRRAVAAAGVYAPGGRAAYPSSVLMCCDPGAGRGRGPGRRREPAGRAGSAQRGRSWRRARSPASTRSTRSAARRRSRRWPTAPRRSTRRPDRRARQSLRAGGQAPRLVGAVGIDGIAGPERADGRRRRNRGPGLDRARPLRAGGARRRTASSFVASPDAALLDASRSWSRSWPPSARASHQAPLALVATTGVEAALSLADAVAPEHLELVFEGADEHRRQGPGRRLRIPRRRRSDRVRRLRRGLQPRAADRRRGPLRRPARPRAPSSAAARSSAIPQRPPRGARALRAALARRGGLSRARGVG